jgi:ubiquitin-protein ligase
MLLIINIITMSENNFNKPKPKRLDKELLLLRNLPKEFKIGKKETPLGIILFVSFHDKSLVPPIDQFNFEILIKDKFPFQPPLIMSKTNFSSPTLADGRDLLLHLLPHSEEDWKPSMNL